MIKHKKVKKEDDGVVHTETLTQVGVDVGIPPYHVGFFFNRQQITDKPAEVKKQTDMQKHETENPKPGD